MTDQTDEQILELHDRAVEIVAECVFGLVEKFAHVGLTPSSLAEGSLKAVTLAFARYEGMTSEEIANLLAEMAEAVRQVPNIPALTRSPNFH